MITLILYTCLAIQGGDYGCKAFVLTDQIGELECMKHGQMLAAQWQNANPGRKVTAYICERPELVDTWLRAFETEL